MKGSWSFRNLGHMDAYLICPGPKSQVLGSNGGFHRRICLNLAVSRYAKSAVHIVVFQLHCSQKSRVLWLVVNVHVTAWFIRHGICLSHCASFVNFLHLLPLIHCFWSTGRARVWYRDWFPFLKGIDCCATRLPSRWSRLGNTPCSSAHSTTQHKESLDRTNGN